MQEVSGSIPLFSTKKALYFAGSMVLFLFRQKDQGCTARHAGGPVTPPISNKTVIRFNACSVFRAAPPAPCQGPPAYLYADGFLWARVDCASRASKKAPQGLFPRRTVRRVDAVRIHPPSLREGYYKTETPVPGSDTGVLGGAKQPKSEPLPSGASLAAISSKVMVFVPSL